YGRNIDERRAERGGAARRHRPRNLPQVPAAGSDVVQPRTALLGETLSLNPPSQASFAKGRHLPVLGGTRHKQKSLLVGIIGELLVAVAELCNGDRPPVLVHFKAVRIKLELDGQHLGARIGANPTMRHDVIDKQVVHIAMGLLVPPGMDALAEQKSAPE